MKILVIRFSRIGDIILTTPVLAAIHKTYPEARIDFLVMDYYQDAIRGNPHVHRLILFDKTRYRGIWGLVRFARTLERYDMVVDLHAKMRSIFLCSQLRSRVLRYRKRAAWKSLGVKLNWIRYHVDDTIVRSYFSPLRRLGVEYEGERLRFDLPPESYDALPELARFAVLAPGAANATKKWPWEFFADLARRLQMTVCLIGAAGETDELEAIRRRVGPRCLNLAGRLTLKQSGALMTRARFVVSNDSAAFHMARALGTKVFVIFGPTDPNLFEFSERAILICAHVPCAPCSLHGQPRCPKGHLECMRTVTPLQVLEQIRANGDI